ncbi:MAG: response regulator [Patescibacteria group bacterium]|nr:response regulator [Patescibacteria group bacterium]
MPGQKKKFILIIEDEQTLARSLTDKLTRSGYRVESEIEGVRGLRKVVETKPDLVILDIILPGLNGLKVLKSLKSKSCTKDIPVILVSNVDDKESQDEGMKLGAANYLIKTNVSLAKIIQEIERHIIK